MADVKEGEIVSAAEVPIDFRTTLRTDFNISDIQPEIVHQDPYGSATATATAYVQLNKQGQPSQICRTPEVNSK